MERKICVYTCITGDYDNVYEYDNLKEKNIDYILFTNNVNIKSTFWRVIYIENNDLDNIRLARKIKILGHDLLKKYDITVWIDGASYLKREIGSFINECCDLDKYSLIGFKHPERDCIYDEAKACVIAGKESKKVIIKQMKFLESENYPKHIGLIESAILVRNTKDKILSKTMKLWFDMVKNYSYRDQLSFNYVAYITKLNYFLLDMKTFDNEYFGRYNHCSKRENRLKKYRLYLGDDSNLENYDYDCDYNDFYQIKDDKFIVELVPNVSGNLIKLRLDNYGGIKIKSIKVLNRNDKNVNIRIIGNTIYREYNVILGDNPTILIDTNYYKDHVLKIEIDMSFVEEHEYREIIDLLYYKINCLNNELCNAKNDNNNYQEMYLKILNSKSWKIISWFREFYNRVKRGVINEKR